ncbi:MAG: acyl-CoA dehydrogenase family protein [Deltaproteobacteria bacterium]|nr:acyl-CoA dehydrogenase family protein [Deltaproteobacteria bacterium]
MVREASFLKALFLGVIPEELAFPYPELSVEERENTRMILESVRDWASRAVDAGAIDRAAKIPPEVLQGLRELGLFGTSIPREHGGGGLSATASARVLQEVAGIDGSLGLTLSAHLVLGTRGLLLYGTRAQQERYLHRMATGECIAAYALTEPGAGSDAASLQTRAEAVGDGYTLQGQKVWVANGGLAELFTVFARTTPPGASHRPKITAFLVERGPGVRAGPELPRLGLRGASATSVTLDGVRVPAEAMLGEHSRGFKVAMEVLNAGRLNLAACALGSARRLVRLAVARLQERRAFGRPIGEFGLLKDKVAMMMADTFAMESMTYLTTGLVDARVPDTSLESACCKVFASEACWRVAHEALQVAAGSGYLQDQPFERMLRDARANHIFEGTNEILRAFIALAGMQGPARKITAVSGALREPIKGFGLLSDVALRRARSALGRDRMNRAHPTLRREVVVLEEHVELLARSVEKVLRKHGKDIAEMQYTQRRVADIAVDLYALTACVARTTRAIERRGEAGAQREIDLTAAFANSARLRLEANARAFDSNDDELRKGIASRAYADGGYTFDVV